jgi:hypothetical protein
MDHLSDAISLPVRLRAVSRALRLLYQLACRKATFAKYGGHFLLAFYFIATTTGNAAIRRQARQMGRERARHWVSRWNGTRRKLNTRTVLDEVFASYAAQQLGIRHDRIRRELQIAVARYTPRELLGFDLPPHRAKSARRGPGLKNSRIKYEAWYCALFTTYFCERHGIALGVRYIDVLNQLPQLRPYPKPGTRNYHDCIYAVTHLVYTLNDYNRSRLSPRLLPREFKFLKASMPWALERAEADTIGEIIDSLAAFGLADSNPLMVKGRAFLLKDQRRDGGWGDEDDDYGRFHSVWTGIDGLRDYGWRGKGISNPLIRRALRGP